MGRAGVCWLFSEEEESVAMQKEENVSQCCEELPVGTHRKEV